MNEDVVLHSSIGRILREHQKQLGVTQSEFAARLGISQPYLSRILRGQRSAVSLNLWNRILEIVPRPELFIADSAMNSTSEAYDRALIALGRGNHGTAEVLLGQIVAQHGRTSAAAMNLVARARFHLAGLQRDRDRLDGTDGAVALYTGSLAYYRGIQARSGIEEVLFMLGACTEMAGDSVRALDGYRRLLERTDPRNQPLVVRTQGRMGALATKMGRLAEADERLRTATEKSIHLDDSYPYSYYHEKLAILRTRQGRLDEAVASLQSARAEIEPGDTLRKVQSMCVEANVFLASGDVPAAHVLLGKALAMARTHEYAHQASYVTALLGSVER